MSYNSDYFKFIKENEMFLMDMWDIFEDNAIEYINVSRKEWDKNLDENMNLFFSILFITK